MFPEPGNKHALENTWVQWINEWMEGWMIVISLVLFSEAPPPCSLPAWLLFNSASLHECTSLLCLCSHFLPFHYRLWTQPQPLAKGHLYRAHKSFVISTAQESLLRRGTASHPASLTSPHPRNTRPRYTKGWLIPPHSIKSTWRALPLSLSPRLEPWCSQRQCGSLQKKGSPFQGSVLARKIRKLF